MARVPTRKIMQALAETYPDAQCALHFTNPFELLIATMLSAQCTDKRVNIITERLFKKYRGPADFAAVSQAELEADIRDCGLFRAKAQNIRETARLLLEKHGGEVPADHAALTALPGVGRKTANVVLSNAFGVPAIAVDTHVFRVANRLGLAEGSTPEKVEQQLMRRLPKAQWSSAHHWLIHHGRAICAARGPKCEICPVLAYCLEGKRLNKGTNVHENR